MKVYNNKNQYYTISDTPFAKGGEGSIYDVLGNANLVAKIYHRSGRTDEKQRKILAMLASPPVGITDQIAWPTDIIYSANSEFLGFMMPRIRNTAKIDSLYSYDKRNFHNFSFFLQVAQNLCAAVSAVHSSGHVCGDLNPANICVDPKTALITLVDTDSYHIKAKDGSVFKCPVCRPEYVPSEVQSIMNTGSSLRDVNADTFTIYTDYFAVAIHIFALLMNGAHPYSCVVGDGYSASQFNIVLNIEKNLFAYEKNNYGITPPKYAPSFSSLPPEIATLFKKMFGKMGSLSPFSRPTVADFHRDIGKLELNLQQCSRNNAHQYYNKNKSCPLCEASSRMKNLFSAPPPKLNPLVGGGGNTNVVATNRNTATNTAGNYITKQARAPAYSSSSSNDIFTWVGMLFGIVVWGISQFFLIDLAQNIYTGLSFVWGLIVAILTLGIIPFIPLWIFAIIFILFKLYNIDFFLGIAVVLDKSLYLAYVGYAVFAIAISWGSLIDVIISPILICLPFTFIAKIVPGLTVDLLT